MSQLVDFDSACFFGIEGSMMIQECGCEYSAPYSGHYCVWMMEATEEQLQRCIGHSTVHAEMSDVGWLYEGSLNAVYQELTRRAQAQEELENQARKEQDSLAENSAKVSLWRRARGLLRR